ncbi:LpqB family beta-propeller domain-containing protein [Actinotignum sp. GS-2025b]|uniref:LpqB family beta-propeller domain-containing protein n=1 Tax=Actinotignum sp. GS-2025b TaxID=3427275 RepID=UPI003F48EFE3
MNAHVLKKPGVGRALAALLSVMILALAGCGRLPRSGPVNEASVPPTEEAVFGLTPAGPATGASPEEVIRGFLLAGSSGAGDDYATARQFLTKEAGRTWNPRSQVRVYPNSQNISPTQREDGTYVISVTAQGTVDTGGRYTEASTDAIHSTTFKLDRNASGEWRIAELEDGIMMTDSLFASMYVRTPLYFIGPGSDTMVPDLRFYPRMTFISSTIAGLLAGPSPWLADAVHSEIPTTLRMASSPKLESGVLTLDVTAEISTLSRESQARAVQQIQRSFTGQSVVPVHSVNITVSGEPLDTIAIADLPTYPYGAYDLTVLENNRPYKVEEGKTRPVFTSGVFDDIHVARMAGNYSDSVASYALLTAQRDALVRVSTDGFQPFTMVRGENLVAPSYDYWGWVWTSEVDNKGVVLAAADDGRVRELTAPFLKGARIREVRASREGARLLIVAQVGDTVQMLIAPIQRDARHEPTALGDPLEVGQRLADVSSVAWISSTDIAVLGRATAGTDPLIFAVRVGGPMERLNVTPYPGSVRLTAGRGEQSIVVLTDQQVVATRDGGAWRPVATGVTDIVLPG